MTKGFLMNNKLKKMKGALSEKEIQKALAALLKNTRITRRHISLIEIADWLDIAVQGIGSLKKVAERIGLSYKMIKQFTYIRKLIPEVQDLFAKRKIDSIDIAVHLSMLDNHEQLAVAREVSKKHLNSADVRAIRELKKDVPALNINEVIEKVKSSRNIKQYIAEFIIQSQKIKTDQLHNNFSKVIKSKNIIKLIKKGAIGRITMSSEGKRLLQEYSTKHGLTKAQAVSLIAKGDIS